jgi:hypothetical protein
MFSLLSVIKKINNSYWSFYVKHNTVVNSIIKRRNISKINCHKFNYYLIKKNKYLFKSSMVTYKNKYNRFFFNKYLLRNNYNVFFNNK